MADEQNTVPINEESPYAAAEEAAAHVTEAPSAPEVAAAPTEVIDAVAPVADPAVEAAEPVTAPVVDPVTEPAEPVTAPVVEATEPVIPKQDVSGFGEPQTAPYSVQTPQPDVSSNPTVAVGAVPDASFGQPTASMPNPYPTPQPTTPIPPAAPYAAATPGYAAPSPSIPTSSAYSAPASAAPVMGDPYANAVATQTYVPDPAYGPLTQQTGAMKFCWLLVGMMLGIPGMLLAWLTNADKHPQVKKDAILWSVIGFAINVVFAVILSVALIGLVAAAVGTTGSYGSPF